MVKSSLLKTVSLLPRIKLQKCFKAILNNYLSLFLPHLLRRGFFCPVRKEEITDQRYLMGTSLDIHIKAGAKNKYHMTHYF